MMLGHVRRRARQAFLSSVAAPASRGGDGVRPQLRQRQHHRLRAPATGWRSRRAAGARRRSRAARGRPPRTSHCAASGAQPVQSVAVFGTCCSRPAAIEQDVAPPLLPHLERGLHAGAIASCSRRRASLAKAKRSASGAAASVSRGRAPVVALLEHLRRRGARRRPSRAGRPRGAPVRPRVRLDVPARAQRPLDQRRAAGRRRRRGARASGSCRAASPRWSVTRMMTTYGGGSSSVFSSADDRALAFSASAGLDDDDAVAALERRAADDVLHAAHLADADVARVVRRVVVARLRSQRPPMPTISTSGMRAGGDPLARAAAAAWRLVAGAVQHLRELQRGQRLADVRGAGEEVRVRDALALRRRR